MNYIAMLALLKALTQEVNLLEVELAQLEASSSVAVATTTPIVFPSSTNVTVNVGATPIPNTETNANYSQATGTWVCYDPSDGRGYVVAGNIAVGAGECSGEFMPESQYSAMFTGNSSSNPSQPSVALTTSTASCSLTAQNEGDDTSPQTYITWTLNGLPTSTMADVQGVRINVNPWDYSSSTHQFSVLATTTENWHLQNEPVGAFPNQNILLVSGWFQSITADFNGATCSVTPNPQQ
jgi:hypothetical protein